MRIDVLDLPSQNIRKHFDQAIEFIDSALRSKGNILVHCSAGISRSPTLVLAYMMKKNHWTLEEAFDKMRKLRQIVDPNVSFIVQLKEWEKYVMSTTVTNEINDDNSGTTNTSRAASNSYCGSTSKNKTDNKSHTDSVIIVN
jgi:protein-tyrosine phosphatase